jgi:hypothetical protein
MNFPNIDAEDRFKAISVNIVDSFGVTLTLGSDFEEFKACIAAVRPDHLIGKPFDPKLNDLRSHNAIWIIGRDERNMIVHLQALCLLPTGRRSLAEYFGRHFEEFFPPEMDIDLSGARYRPGPGARRIAGHVVYSGETWIGGEKGKYRNTGLSNLLGRFALFTAMTKLNADYVVGFMAQPVAYKGFCLRMGFMHAEPMALRWQLKGEAKVNEGVMVYMSRDDIKFTLELPTDAVQMLAAA